MLGIVHWPSARAVSTLSHRSSLQKSSLFSFVGFLRQNRHSGVLTGCCVLTAGIKPHGNVPASLSLFRVGNIQCHASPQEGNGGQRAHCWSLSIPTTRRNLTQPPFAAPTGYPDQLPNAGFVVTKLLLQAHHGGKAMHPSPGNLAFLNSSPKAQEWPCWQFYHRILL